MSSSGNVSSNAGGNGTENAGRGPDGPRDDALLTTGAVAKRRRVSAQAVRKWREAGLPVAGTKRHAGREIPLFDPEVVDRWVEENTGGRRGGSRVRPENPPPEEAGDETGDETADEAADRSGERSTARSDHRLTVEDAVLGCTEHELMALAAAHAEFGLTKTAADRFESIMRSRKLSLQVREAAGELIDRSEVVRVMAAHCSAIAERVRGLSSRLTPRVLAAADADPAVAAAVSAVLSEEAEAILSVAHRDLFHDEETVGRHVGDRRSA